MKQLVLLIVLLISVAASTAQVKAPEFLILPDDEWCQQHGYLINPEDKDSDPDYPRTLADNPDMAYGLKYLSSLISQAGLPVIDLEKAISEIEQNSETDKTSQGESQMTSYDKLQASLSPDIIIWLSLKEQKVGFSKLFICNIEATEAQSGKVIARTNGQSPPFSGPSTELIQMAIEASISDLYLRLERYFDQLLSSPQN